MRTPSEGSRDDSLPPPWGETAVRAAIALIPRAEEIADHSVGWVCEHDPEYSDLVPTADLRNASRLCVQLVLSQVAAQPLADELHTASEAIGRARAAQTAPLEAVLRGLRIDYRLVWEAMLELAATDPDLDMLELLTAGAARVWDVIDAISVAVAAAYREVEGELRRSSEEQAAILMSALIRGASPVDVTVRQAAAQIGLTASERFVVCCADAADSFKVSGEAMRRLLAASGMRSAWYAESGTQVGVVQIGSQTPGAVRDVLATMSDIRVGISAVLDGLGAVRDNVWQAEAALRAIPQAASGAVTIETHLVASITAATPDLALLLSRRVLAPLSVLRPAERARILRTVAAYVNGTGSVSETASELHYHRNTIVNHLRQFEQHTGKSLHNPRELAEIVIALEAERMIG
jgi:DNA-binding PucR family transcriptional regulator